ncbi:32790_t:CDS:2, partial [Racocetra persica]
QDLETCTSGLETYWQPEDPMDIESQNKTICFNNPSFDNNSSINHDVNKALVKSSSIVVSVDSGANVDGIDIFSQIKFPKPSVIINNEFVSINSTVSPGTSSTACVEVERILSLLEKHKNDIERILDSQNVYAIGPEFQQGCTIPCIACWVNETLSEIVIEELSNIFDNEFEIVVILLNTDDSNSFNYKSSNNLSVSSQQSDDKNESEDKRNGDDNEQNDRKDDERDHNKKNNHEDEESNEKNCDEGGEKNGDRGSRKN